MLMARAGISILGHGCISFSPHVPALPLSQLKCSLFLGMNGAPGSWATLGSRAIPTDPACGSLNRPLPSPQALPSPPERSCLSALASAAPPSLPAGARPPSPPPLNLLDRARHKGERGGQYVGYGSRRKGQNNVLTQGLA